MWAGFTDLGKQLQEVSRESGGRCDPSGRTRLVQL